MKPKDLPREISDDVDTDYTKDKETKDLESNLNDDKKVQSLSEQKPRI